MDRWWTDPQQSAQTLEHVGTSDTVQGVGTAVLGYHGLSEGVLRPLVNKTLMDVDSVSRALNELDITPVAKAMAQATRSTLGDAADKYGELLARDLHSRAVDSTGRFILNLVSTGIPWPTAIERAASVHGIPVDRLGKAASTLRAPALAKIAQADIADRALMEYALHVGNRESVPDAVSKSDRQREFKEELIVRDAIGRFAEKPNRSLVALSAEAKSDFLARQQRRNRKKNRGQTAQAPSSLLSALIAREDSQPASLKQLSRAAQDKPTLAVVEEEAARSLDEVREKTLTKIRETKLDDVRQKVIDGVVQALVNRKSASDEQVDQMGDLKQIPDSVKKRPDGTYQGYVLGSSREQQYAIVDKKVLERAAEQGGFNWAQLKNQGMVYGSLNANEDLLDKDGLREAVLSYSRVIGDEDPLSDLAIIAFDGLVAYDSDFTDGVDARLADGGVYSVSRRNHSVGLKGLEYDDYLDLNLKVYAVPGMSTGPQKPVDLPHLTVVLENDKDFDGSIYKSSQRQWRESDVVRDERGRFADESDSRSTKSIAQEDQLSRIDRKRRKKTRKDRLTQVQSSALLNALESREAQKVVAQPVSQAVGQNAVESNSEDLFDQLRDDAYEKIRAKAFERALARSAEQVKQRQESLGEFRSTHDEWKALKAVKFSHSEDMATFSEIFDYDPYTATSMGLGGLVDEFERQDAIDFAISGRIKPITDVVEGIYYGDVNTAVGAPIPASEFGDTSYHHLATTSPYDAMSLAKNIANVVNAGLDDQTREYMPMVVADDEHAQYVVYRPYLREVQKREEDVVVLGTEADWNSLKRGEKVSLVPLDGYDEDPEQPGQGLFKDMLYAVGEDETIQRDTQTFSESDFYIRAFRLKR